jgi:probable HAF family extracellular repeat protein
MQPRTESGIVRLRTWSRWLSCLLLGLFVAGVAAQEESVTVRPAQTTYRIVPLSPEQVITSVDINATGQVAFTEYINGAFRARFFDGYAVRNIGSLGGPSTVANAVNDLGQVAGTASVDAAGTMHRAYRWSVRTGMVDLGRRLPGESSGNDINNRGQVTGGAVFSPGQARRGFLWTPETRTVVNIGSLDLSSYGTALNDAGTITGLTGGDSLRAFRWTRREGMRAITSIYNEFTTANDINAAGHIVGAAALSTNPSQPAHAFLWTPREGLIDLGTGFANRTIAEKINDSDMVIGNVRDFVDFPHGFVWTRETGSIEIGAGLAKTVTSTADLNKFGQVVGGFGGRAYVWTRAQGVVDLNTRLRGAPEGLVLQGGRAISDNGAIVAQGNTGLVLLVPTAASGNEAPVVGPVKVTGMPRVQALLSFSAEFRDADPGDSHRATWAWGDGASATGTVSERSGRGNVSGQHAYRSPGSYTVSLTVTDSSGRRTTVHQNVVVRGPVPPVQR